MAGKSQDIPLLSAILFKVALLILALLLGLQLISDQLPFEYDIMTLFSFEQFIFLFAVLIVTVLAFLEGFTLQRRTEFNFGVLVLYIVSAIGGYFVVLIAFFDYNFNDSTMNTYLGYYLLLGVVLILVNARQNFSKLFSRK